MKVDLTAYSGSVLLAVSGGVDSMALLDLFIRGFSGDMLVATVNHGIRQEGADDCSFVAEYCAKHNIPCTVCNVDAVAYAKQQGVSLETAARILRHACLRECAEGRVIVTAHHKDDQAETVLMHLLRGSGAKGLCGMKVLDGNYWRPLLETSKAELLQYAVQNNLPYVTDYTNSDDSYTRNYLRNVVMPQLLRVNSNAVDNVVRCAKLISSDEAFLSEVASVALTARPLRVDGDGADITLQLLQMNYSVATRCVISCFEKLGITKDIEQVHIEDVIALRDKSVGKQINLPFNLIARRLYDCVRIEKQRDNLTYIDSVSFALGQHEVAGKTVVVSHEGDGLHLNLNAIPSNAVLRTRRVGDTFTKFGGGTKKLADYLSDKKIPKADRDSLVLLASGSDVLAIVGVEISDKVKIADNSKEIRIYYKE